jgi:hypothetical protein
MEKESPLARRTRTGPGAPSAVVLGAGSERGGASNASWSHPRGIAPVDEPEGPNREPEGRVTSSRTTRRRRTLTHSDSHERGGSKRLEPGRGLRQLLRPWGRGLLARPAIRSAMPPESGPWSPQRLLRTAVSSSPRRARPAAIDLATRRFVRYVGLASNTGREPNPDGRCPGHEAPPQVAIGNGSGESSDGS